MPNYLKFHHRLLLFLLFLLLFIMTHIIGCTSLPVESPLPDNFTMVKLSPSEANSPIAWNPKENKIALVDGGLVVIDIDTRKREVIDSRFPTALAWSPDGQQLAAGYYADGQTILSLHKSNMSTTGRTSVDGYVSKIFWLSDGKLLAAAVQVTLFPVWTDFQTKLVYWDGQNDPISEPLALAKLPRSKPRSQMEISLSGYFHVSLSPLQDEIFYSEFISPPLIQSYLKLKIKHLESGAEREVVEMTSLASKGGVFSGDGEEILFGDGEATFHRINPWTGKGLLSLPYPGRFLATSPGGKYLFVDGELFDEDQLLISFPEKSEVFFSPSGSSLVLRNDTLLYFLAGFEKDAPIVLSPEKKRLLLEARKLRAMHLISVDEYYARKNIILKSE